MVTSMEILRKELDGLPPVEEYGTISRGEWKDFFDLYKRENAALAESNRNCREGGKMTLLDLAIRYCRNDVVVIY